MLHCATCGTRFDDDGKRVLCGNCAPQDAAVVDGSQEQWNIVRNLSKLANVKLSEDDLKLIADSWAFMQLCEKALPYVEQRCLMNLLRKVQRERE